MNTPNTQALDALAEFTEYFVKNYPGPNTIIGDPHWHAPRIFRAAERALTPSRADTAGACQCDKCQRNGALLRNGSPFVMDPLLDRDDSKAATEQGLFRKFDVRRTDGSDAPGGKHHGCDYFVLDVTHDPHARAALTAYADAVEATHPQLATDMRSRYGLPAPAGDAQGAAEGFVLVPARSGKDYVDDVYGPDDLAAIWNACREESRRLNAAAPTPEAPSGSQAGEVIELRMCELRHLILRKDTPYVFTVDPNCEKCRDVAMTGDYTAPTPADSGVQGKEFCDCSSQRAGWIKCTCGDAAKPESA